MALIHKKFVAACPTVHRNALVTCFFLFVFLFVASQASFGARKPDSGSSQNGASTAFPSCPDPNATPNFVVLDGSSSCGVPFTSRVITLTDANNTFRVTITPALWINGFFGGNTILNVQLTNLTSSQTQLTLQSLVVGTVLDSASYVVCDNIGGLSPPFCTQGLLNLSAGGTEVLQPTPITGADLSTTRWDFNQLTATAGAASSTLSLVVDGIPAEFLPSFGNTANQNSLSFAANAAPTSFLAVVSNGTSLIKAGTVQLQAAPPAVNDLFNNATLITSPSFNDFIDTSAVINKVAVSNPLEILSGANAGQENPSQGDPVPSDPNVPDAGINCTSSWTNRGRGIVFRSVWYTFTVVSGGTVTVSTDGSRYDTGIYVFTGTPASPTTPPISPTPVACNDDSPPITINSQSFKVNSSDVTFTAVPGTYYVMISEVPPDIGKDQNGNPIAGPLANDATLKMKFTSTAGIGTPVATVGSAPVFQPQPVGTTSSAQPLTITNTGTAPLSVAKITTTGPFVAASSTCGSPLAPSSTCMISLTFTPTTAGTSSGILTITDNASNSPQTVNLSGTGVAPVGSVSPSSLNFGAYLVASTSTSQRVALTNTGSGPMAVSGLVVTGDFHVVTNFCNKSIAPNTHCDVYVVFTPSAVGARTGNLTFQDNATNTPQTVSLSGTGTEITVSAASIIFPTQLLGTSSSARAITVTNHGTSLLNITGITSKGDFSKTTTCGSTLAGGASCAISTTFKPTLIGTRTGKLTISDSDPASPQVVVLTGVGTAIGFSPTSLTFASQLVGTSSNTKNTTITNHSATTVSITAITITGDFGIAGKTCGTTIAPSASCTVSVSFKPKAIGTRSGTLSISDNGGGSPQTLTLSGIGTDVTLAPSTLTFGNVPVGTTTSPKKVTVTNHGGTPLSVASISISGANSNNFSQINTCGTTLAAGASCTINVTFRPSAKGIKAAGLNINDNGGGSPQTISLSGTGT